MVGGLVADLAPLTVTYVLIMAVVGPLAARLVELPSVEHLAERVGKARSAPPA